MPRSTGGRSLVLAVALLLPGYAVAVEQGADAEADVGGGKDQGHVDLSIGGRAEDTAGGDRGYDHVDFSIDGSNPINGGDKEQGHVDFSVDPEGAYAAQADLVPGTGGAEIRGFDGCADNVHVDFRIVIRDDGRIEVNGQELAIGDPAKGCRVSVSWCAGTGALVVQAEDATGAVHAAQYALDRAPEGVRFSAAEVRFLSVLRQ